MTAITTAGIYDLPFEQYLGKGLTPTPPLSASTIKTMLKKSPKHAANEHVDIGNKKKEKEMQKSTIIGIAAHSIILKQSDVRLAISPYPEFRTNEAKEWKKQKKEAGFLVIKEEDFDEAVEIANAFHPLIDSFSIELGEKFPETEFEKTVVVQINGVWCKIRIDALGQSIRDVKTAAADVHPQSWTKNQISAMGYDVSAAFYKRVWKELTGEDKRYILDVIEQEDPYDGYSLILGDIGMELANEKITWALDTWKRGIETGVWAGYSNGRVIYADPPVWELSSWEEFKALEKTRSEILQREAA